MPDAWEDLNALNLLILGGLPLANDGSFKGRPDDRSSDDHQIYLSQEEWQPARAAALKELTQGNLCQSALGFCHEIRKLGFYETKKETSADG